MNQTGAEDSMMDMANETMMEDYDNLSLFEKLEHKNWRVVSKV